MGISTREIDSGIQQKVIKHISSSIWIILIGFKRDFLHIMKYTEYTS